MVDVSSDASDEPFVATLLIITCMWHYPGRTGVPYSDLHPAEDIKVKLHSGKGSRVIQ